MTRWRLEGGFGFAKNRRGDEAFVYISVAGGVAGGVPQVGTALRLQVVPDPSRAGGGWRAIRALAEAPPGLGDRQAGDRYLIHI